MLPRETPSGRLRLPVLLLATLLSALFAARPLGAAGFKASRPSTPSSRPAALASLRPIAPPQRALAASASAQSVRLAGLLESIKASAPVPGSPDPSAAQSALNAAFDNRGDSKSDIAIGRIRVSRAAAPQENPGQLEFGFIGENPAESDDSVRVVGFALDRSSSGTLGRGSARGSIRHEVGPIGFLAGRPEARRVPAFGEAPASGRIGFLSPRARTIIIDDPRENPAQLHFSFIAAEAKRRKIGFTPRPDAKEADNAPRPWEPVRVRGFSPRGGEEDGGSPWRWGPVRVKGFGLDVVAPDQEDGGRSE